MKDNKSGWQFPKALEIIKSKEGNYDMLYVETSTPGLKGQSGGPIFDTNGHIYAMQVQPNHIPLGFHPISEYDGKSIEKNQFLNVGY